MTQADEFPQSDVAEGALHPRLTNSLYGQQKAENAFLEAFNADRLHHAWLILGPKGIGKATLAWKIARFLLTLPPKGGGLFGESEQPLRADSLASPEEHPVQARINALSEPGLFLLRRVWDEDRKKFKAGIGVDDVRALKSFFQLSSADGGRRVVIVDSADDMNINAANALLKFLEEPPDDTVILLVSHQPSRLLPTIRSRCRELRCDPLSPEDMARVMSEQDPDNNEHSQSMAELSGGSAGGAIRLAENNGLEVYQSIVDLFATPGDFDRSAALALAESAVGAAKEPHYQTILLLIDLFLTRLARTGAKAPPIVEAAKRETEVLQRLAPDPRSGREWADLQQVLSARAQHAKSVNLDPAALILDMVFKINDMAARIAAR